MKAVWYERNGGANEVLIYGDLPTPQPAENEVRVKLFASGVNPSDVKSRLARPLQDSFIVPHSDGAGIIDAIGEGVDAERLGSGYGYGMPNGNDPWEPQRNMSACLHNRRLICQTAPHFKKVPAWEFQD